MPLTGYPHNYLSGLSALWTQFFADSDKLASLYQGAAVLMGQAYLDLLSNVLNVSLHDAPIFNKEFYKFIAIREDEVTYQRGAAPSDDRWLYTLPDGVVDFASLDNLVLEPTISLQNNRDYDIDNGVVRFYRDPTDPQQTGIPALGFARRSVTIEPGGSFDDTARSAAGESWISRGVRKGDTLRVLDLSVDLAQQRKHADYLIVLVRDSALYISSTTPLPLTPTPNVVILRTPSTPSVSLEPLVYSVTGGGSTVPVATLVHSRIDQGSVRVYAKRTFDGGDVVEGTDYVIDYEHGLVYVMSAGGWASFSPNKIDYTWKQEVWPTTGIAPPRFITTGRTLATPTSSIKVTTKVFQIALWAPDAMIDRQVLANNFGTLVGILESQSSESYRALLQGIFQLYLLGPVVRRIESALNVILGLPVIRDDGEVLLSIETEATYNRITTRRPSALQPATYDFPKLTPLRTDIQPGYVFSAFEPLTTAATVTDYVQDTSWWHDMTIPEALFSSFGSGEIPSASRRTAGTAFVRHVVGAEDNPKVGDPGLKVGADEDGNVPSYGAPIYRHRLAFILMDRYLKYHTFYVRFDSDIFTVADAARYARSFDDLQKFVISAKPKHTFAFVQPLTAFRDEVFMAEDGYFQPPNQLGQDPDGPELFSDPSQVDPAHPYVQLGLRTIIIAA